MKTAEEIVAQLGGKPSGKNRWMAKCPCHEDDKASLQITQSGGHVLFKCFAGCDFRALADAIGLFGGEQKPSQGRRIVATYDYRDENGKLIYQSVRTEPKKFFQRRPDGSGGWIQNMTNARRVLYHLPELVASPARSMVFVVEGEKDADRLIAHGFNATCNVGGAGKWKPEYNDYFRDKFVVIVPDNDDPGRKHAKGIALAVSGIAACCKIIDLPGVPPKGDISDWFDADGSPDSLIALVDAAPEVTAEILKEAEPTIESNGYHQKAPLATQYLADYPSLLPPVIGNDAGVGLLRKTETMNIIAPSKVGKSFLVVDLSLSIATGKGWLGYETPPGRVLVIDNELHPETFTDRLRRVMEARGITADDLGDRLSILSLRGELCDLEGIENWIAAYAKDELDLVVLDAFYRFVAKGDDENSNADISNMYNQIDRLAKLTGAAFTIVHHSTKGDQSNKEITDIGSGGGSMSRACDTHVIFRRHAEEGCVTVEAACRSWRTPEKQVLCWVYPLWMANENLDPNDLKAPKGRHGRQGRDAERIAGITTEEFAERYFDEARSVSESTEIALRDGIPVTKIRRLISAAVAKGLIWPTRIAGQKAYTPNKADRELTDDEIAEEMAGQEATWRKIREKYGVGGARAANIMLKIKAKNQSLQ
jgi:hypothetical protein